MSRHPRPLTDMTMRTGLDWSEDPYAGSPLQRLNDCRCDWIRFVLDWRMREQPGTRWEYVSGDVILLGNASWRIQRIEAAGRVLVEDAHGAPPSVPFWFGEAPQRTSILCDGVGELREEISERSRGVSPHCISPAQPEVAAAMAWLWLPETVHRAQAGTGNPLRFLPALIRRPVLRPP